MKVVAAVIVAWTLCGLVMVGVAKLIDMHIESIKRRYTMEREKK